MDSQKVEAIETWEPPKAVSEVRSFLAWRVTIGDSWKKVMKFEWSNRTFQEIKRGLTMATFLTLSMPGKEYEVFCDVSHQDLGCVLMQHRKVIA